MNTSVNPNCGSCGGSEIVWVYYKNEQERYVHCDWLYCPVCFPVSKEMSSLRQNEAVIDSTEFRKLLEEGFREIEIGG